MTEPAAQIQANSEGWFPYRYRVLLRYRYDHPGVVEWRVIESESGRAWTAARQESRVLELMDRYHDRADRDGRSDEPKERP